MILSLSTGLKVKFVLAKRLVISGWDIDVNAAYRRRPSRFIDGEFLNEIIPFIYISEKEY